jgi:hypothetical protein
VNYCGSSSGLPFRTALRFLFYLLLFFFFFFIAWNVGTAVSPVRRCGTAGWALAAIGGSALFVAFLFIGFAGAGE